MKKIMVLFLLFYGWQSLATVSCSLKSLDDLSPDIREAYYDIYQKKVPEAEAVLRRSGGRIEIDGQVFTKASDYAGWFARKEATEVVTKRRVGELEDVIRDAWTKQGRDPQAVEKWIDQLKENVESGHAIWDRGNFRYINTDGSLQGSVLIPDNLQQALAASNREIAEAAAKLGDEGAKEIVEEIYKLNNVKRAITEHARSQSWNVLSVRGETVVEIREINKATELGRKLSRMNDLAPGQRLLMGFGDDGTSVTFRVVDETTRQIVAPVKTISGTDFYNGLFK